MAISIVVVLISAIFLFYPGTGRQMANMQGHAIGTMIDSTEVHFSFSYMPENVKTTECSIQCSWDNSIITSDTGKGELNGSIAEPLQFTFGDLHFSISYVDDNHNGLVDVGDIVKVVCDHDIVPGSCELIIVYNGTNEEYGKNIIVSRFNG
jgi:hypothetical protein